MAPNRHIRWKTIFSLERIVVNFSQTFTYAHYLRVVAWVVADRHVVRMTWLRNKCNFSLFFKQISIFDPIRYNSISSSWFLCDTFCPRLFAWLRYIPRLDIFILGRLGRRIGWTGGRERTRMRKGRHIGIIRMSQMGRTEISEMEAEIPGQGTNGDEWDQMMNPIGSRNSRAR